MVSFHFDISVYNSNLRICSGLIRDWEVLKNLSLFMRCNHLNSERIPVIRIKYVCH